MRAPRPQRLAALSLAVTLAACGSRALTPSADGAQGPDPGRADGQRVPGREAGAPPIPCVVAVRFGGCCDQVLPVPAASLGSDPCVVAYRPGVEVPAACELRRPEICPAMMCPPLKPLTLLAEAKLDGSCTWKSECAADGDCVVAEDCRAPKECCSCGTILPRVVAEADACVIYGKKSYPQPGCGQRCPDFCGEGTPPPTPIGSCRELDSVGWPGLRRCEPAVGARASSSGRALFPARAGPAFRRIPAASEANPPKSVI